MRKVTLLLAAIIMLTVSLPHFSASTARAADAKTFIIGIAENSTSLDPARGYEQQTTMVHMATYDTLVTFPADNVEKIIPNLATAWTISDDGKTYTFTLKEGVKFASGNVMTADDVVFSFNRLKNVKGNPSSLAGGIESVTATDPKTVVLKLKEADPSILAVLIFPAFSVTDAKTIKAQGGTDAADADKTDKAEAWLNSNSAGTGPYMLSKWEKNNEMLMVKNPNYNGDKPAAFDQIIMRDMPKAATQKAALEAGDVDIALDLTADQVPSLKGNADLTVYESVSPILFFLLMNQDKAISGPLSDPKVQRAVRLALDYQGIVKLAGGSAATPGSLIPLGFASAFTTDQAIKQDVEGAKKLMAEAGASNVKVDFSYPDFTYQGINLGVLAQKVQSDLKAIGIELNLKPASVQVALASYRDGKDAMSLWFWGPDFIDPLNYVEFLPQRKVGLRAMWTNDNSGKDIQALRDAVLVETDPAKRDKLFADIQTYWQESGPFAPIVQPGIQIAYKNDLKGFAYNPQWIINPASFSR